MERLRLLTAIADSKIKHMHLRDVLHKTTKIDGLDSLYSRKKKSRTQVDNVPEQKIERARRDSNSRHGRKKLPIPSHLTTKGVKIPDIIGEIIYTSTQLDGSRVPPPPQKKSIPVLRFHQYASTTSFNFTVLCL